MITCKLYGRLGNQCLQLAAAIAHAKKMGVDWRAPYRSADPRIWPTYFPHLPATRNPVSMHVYKEKRHCFDPIPEHKDMLLDGYFQSEKYFLEAKKEVETALQFDHHMDGDYIAMHIRRGDFLQYPDQFPVLPMDYYQEAMNKAYKMYPELDFFIYSDDMEWCKSYWEGSESFVRFCTIADPLAAMRHMYNARAFIIANSTFSLFPALLRQDDPWVIAPKESRWYGPKNSHLETCDLMPERFIKL